MLKWGVASLEVDNNTSTFYYPNASEIWSDKSVAVELKLLWSLASFLIFADLRSANIRKLTKDHKSYGSAANKSGGLRSSCCFSESAGTLSFDKLVYCAYYVLDCFFSANI